MASSLSIGVSIAGTSRYLVARDGMTASLPPGRPARYIEDFDQTVAKSSTPAEVIDVMLAKYPAYGNRYTLFTAASTQFPS